MCKIIGINRWQMFSSTKNNCNVKKEERAMAKLAKDQLVKYNGDETELGKIQFRYNLCAIINMANQNV